MSTPQPDFTEKIIQNSNSQLTEQHSNLHMQQYPFQYQYQYQYEDEDEDDYDNAYFVPIVCSSNEIFSAGHSYTK
ncbi:hypothetical protein DAMA08_053910 [Martiniozyma asiatica (nom. inval.)]|nr:hypothetical protein DAMA08_053910 [Martiniozyma asiatica]